MIDILFYTDKWVSIDKVSLFLTKVPNLKSLMIDSLFPNLDYFKRLFQLCPQVDHFQFRHFTYVQGLDYIQLGKLLNQNVKHLYVHNIQTFDLFKLMIDQMDQLESFHSYYGLKDDNFIFKMKSLNKLILGGINGLEIPLALVNKLIENGINQTLIHFELAVVWNYNDHETAKEISLKLGKYFPKLKTLSIHNIKFFWPRSFKLSFLELKKLYYSGPTFELSIFNENQLINLKTLELIFDGGILERNITGMNKIFPNLQNFTIRFHFGELICLDGQLKMKILKNFCDEISKMVTVFPRSQVHALKS